LTSFLIKMYGYYEELLLFFEFFEYYRISISIFGLQQYKRRHQYAKSF